MAELKRTEKQLEQCEKLYGTDSEQYARALEELADAVKETDKIKAAELRQKANLIHEKCQAKLTPKKTSQLPILIFNMIFWPAIAIAVTLFIQAHKHYFVVASIIAACIFAVCLFMLVKEISSTSRSAKK